MQQKLEIKLLDSLKSNLDYKKEGTNLYHIFDKKENKLTVEVSHSNSGNIVKFFMNKGIEGKTKELITKLFIEIANY